MPIIKSINRSFDEDHTVLSLLGYDLSFTARPIRIWNRCQWSLFRNYSQNNTFRFQCPWITLVIKKGDKSESS